MELIRAEFIRLTREFLERGATLADIKLACGLEKRKKRKSFLRRYVCNKKLILVVLMPLLYSIVLERAGIDFVMRYTQDRRCLVPNNYFVWEFTRPVSDCDFCRGVDSALVLDNLTREQFEPYAYSSKPMIVKKAASHWLAAKVFSLQFFRSLYERVEGAYESVEEEGQFLAFRSDFANLREVFAMSEPRAVNLPGEEPWYVGWKNCHPEIVEILRKFYEPPHFLPDDAEIPNTNYIFLGYDQGAAMHVS